jgi:hypothetical protein
MTYLSLRNEACRNIGGSAVQRSHEYRVRLNFADRRSAANLFILYWSKDDSGDSYKMSTGFPRISW